MGYSQQLPSRRGKLQVIGFKGRRGGSRLRWVAIILVAVLIGLAVGLTLLAQRAEPIIRKRIVETLSTRFNSKVELDGFHVTLKKGVEVSGEGLRVYPNLDNQKTTGMPPLLAINNFRFRSSFWALLESPMHVHKVSVNGMQLSIPPKGERQQFRQLGRKTGKIRIAVDEFLCENVLLLIYPSKQGKPPLDFEIGRLALRSIGPGRPMRFDATLINPKPVGNIQSAGTFGPLQADSPGDSPVQGSYSFTNADLGTINGIGGILSSTGKYGGTLDHILVDGETHTPDFRIKISGRPVPLHTKFHAIVDGTSGDTYLQPVEARILNSSLTATGFVIRRPELKGHEVKLEVAVDDARIEDLLKLGVRTDPPVMTGAVSLKTSFDLPPGPAEVSDRLLLSGTFGITGARFTGDKIQRKVDSLSLRSQGKPQLAKLKEPVGISSRMSGTFRLRNSVLSFPKLNFQVPGTYVAISGVYSLDGNRIDFHGKARFAAKLSHMVGGWKSILLKPADPFFSSHGGTELPIKITGTKSEPHFGLDLGHKEK
jgi:hypothetical protein